MVQRTLVADATLFETDESPRRNAAYSRSINCTRTTSIRIFTDWTG